MLHDQKRLTMTRSVKEYELYEASLSETQKNVLSRIGNENLKFLLEEYIRLLKNESDPLIYITDFMSWMDRIMIIYDANTYFDNRDKEIDDLMRGQYDPGSKEKL